ncbi:hypothetical protein RhiLY_00055 [Ceratobasidium sp. AG-Ba]|nr:hypothetical protein RhiLY_00055 [Ceratobasidium sp. AG-Ba]
MSFARPYGSLIDSGNRLLGSSSNHRLQAPHKVGYPDGWRTGPTEEWYSGQQNKTFDYLEYRKEREAPFYHEFIVVRLTSDQVCRFDRRGDVNTRANAFTFEGITAEDTAHVIHTSEPVYTNMIKESDSLLEMRFDKKQDLLTILGICYGVQKDDHTRAYTLTKYNCYFLCWVIITATARRMVDWPGLSRESDKWEALVRTTINGLNSESSSLGEKIKDQTGRFVGRFKAEAKSSLSTEATPFAGMSYLTSTLRKALFSTRSDIQKLLGELILQTTIYDPVREIVNKSAEKAAAEAARSHAKQAARDAAMDAVVETMWRFILASQNGGQMWEDQSKAAEDAVWKAASAAAEADSQVQGDAGTSNWEKAWDSAWTESWSRQNSNGPSQSSETAGAAEQSTISLRAKEAWRTAWTEALQANHEYVPRIKEGVTKYVKEQLPDFKANSLDMTVHELGLVEYLKSLKNGSNKTNSGLQDCIQKRIASHCVRVRNVGVFQDASEIEEAMRRVWVQALSALGPPPIDSK